MKSPTGSLLTKIAAMFTIIIAILAFLGGIIATGVLLNSSEETIKIGEEFMQSTEIALLVFGILTIISIGCLILGLLLLMASRKMRNPKTTRNGAIWAIVLGVLTLEGFIGILALIGGIIGLVDSNK